MRGGFFKLNAFHLMDVNGQFHAEAVLYPDDGT